MSALHAPSAEAFARQGPLFSSLPSPLPDPQQWAAAGALLLSSLGSDRTDTCELMVEDLDEELAVRIFHLYLPIYFWCRHRVRLVAESGGGPVAIGLSAPQGCGKTTLVTALKEMFLMDGLVCADVSIDDFYITGAEQEQLSASHPSNPLWKVRGNAGTHELALGSSTISALLRGEREVPIPRYDKAARGGKGDRKPRSAWPVQVEAPDVVLLEGWMAGFKPLPSAHPTLSTNAGLPEINAALGAYDAWDVLLDSWVVLAVDDIEHVFNWRLQAERGMAATGRPGMSDEEVRDFVIRYMPAYNAYLPGLYSAAEASGIDGKPTLLVQMDGQRRPVSR
uniref:Phosphoribulokinase/uridine kinase domain-containing protein n=1 Tax=Coccolithus braarudii TaxID=221442 RepID=A0A7S0L905_9EUKA